MREFRNSSFKYLYNLKPHKIFSPLFTQGDIQSLQSFSSNQDIIIIIIIKPDKGRGVFIGNKSKYINSMQAIISDRSKFIPMTNSRLNLLLKVKTN